MVQFVVYGVAQPQGSKSARVLGGKAILTEGFGDGPRKRKAWRQAVADGARAWQETHRAALIEGPIRLELWFFLPRPASAPKRVFAPAKKPDLSKLTRSAEDSLKGIIWRDDSEVVDSHTFKRFADSGPPCAVVRVREITDADQLQPFATCTACNDTRMVTMTNGRDLFKERCPDCAA